MKANNLTEKMALGRMHRDEKRLLDHGRLGYIVLHVLLWYGSKICWDLTYLVD